MVTVWQASCWVLQPVAAVFALRSAGERRVVPALGIAILAASMPTFLFRLWHAALSSHFVLLLMLGLALRIVRPGAGAGPRVAAAALQVATRGLHPYLLAMATLVFASTPLTLAWRCDRRWRPVALTVASSSALTLGLALALGYGGAGSEGGYGYYSLNLLAPFWPTYSRFWLNLPFAPIDGTGGQPEGYQYLGLGLIALAALSLAGWRDWRARIVRHPGLALVLAAALPFATTNWVFLGHLRLLHVPFPSRTLAQARASGRFFWPVAYALLVGATVVVSRRPVTMPCSAKSKTSSDVGVIPRRSGR